MNAASDVTARFLHAVKGEAPVSVGHGPIIFIWKAGNATRKGETDNEKLLPNRGKPKKKKCNNKKPNLLMGGVIETD